MPRHVITGAPGTGKTTLLAALASDHPTIAEPARQILAEYREDPGHDLVDGEQFVGLLLQRAIEQYHAADPARVTIFDRGIPDCVAYALISGVDPGPARAAAELYRYEEPVFLAPPWRAIYHTDEERRATFLQVEAFHAALLTAYHVLGYGLTVLPCASVDTRAEVVRMALTSQQA